MKTLNRSILFVSAMAAFAGCGGPEAATANGSALLVAAATGTWQPDGVDYVNNCADQCGVPNCGCIKNHCAGDVEGQACSPVGAACNFVANVAGPTYEELLCQAPSAPPPHTWKLASDTSCFSHCALAGCGCIRNRCLGNPTGQACSAPGATCNLISGTNVIGLTCG